VSLADQAASEDTRLALAMGREDLEAEREFALRFLPGIRAMLRARLRNSGRAADLVQDVMIDNRLSVSIRSPDANDPCISSGMLVATSSRLTLHWHHPQLRIG